MSVSLPPVPPASGDERSAAPLAAPQYGASLTQAMSRFFRKYATFSGRASLSEYWWVALLLGVAYSVALTLIYGGLFTGEMIWRSTSVTGSYANGDGTSTLISDRPYVPFDYPVPGAMMISGIVLLPLIYLATVVPLLALIWRRLHDADLSGGWYFISGVPFFGAIPLLVVTVLPSNPAGARFDAPQPRAF